MEERECISPKTAPARAARRARLWAVGAVVVLVAVMGIAAMGLGGCGGETPASSDGGGSEATAPGPAPSAGEDQAPGDAAGAVKKIALVAPEKGNDFGWNQQGVESAKALAAELGAEIEISDGAGYGDIAPIYRQLVAGKADLILLWASGYNTVGPQLAEEAGVMTAVIDGGDKGLIPGLCVDFETDAQQGAYLAGIVAARMSQTGMVGIVISADDVNWNKMAGGFIAGAKATRPDLGIRLAQAGPAAYADAPAGKRVTDSLIAAGADIIFGMGDGSTFGMIEAVETAKVPAGAEKVWFIDVIGDKSSLDDKGVLLTSVVWDYLPVLRAAVADIEAGTFGTVAERIDLANGGIRLLKSDAIPAEVWAEVEEAREAIMAGTIEVPVAGGRGDLDRLLK